MIDIIINYLHAVPPPFLLKCTYQKGSLATLFRLIFTKDHFNEKTFAIASNLLNVTQDKNSLIVIQLTQFLQLNNKSIKYEDKANKFDKHNVNVENLGKKIGELLLENSEPDKTGLLVDWLSSVELQIAGPNEKLQVDYQIFIFFFFF